MEKSWNLMEPIVWEPCMLDVNVNECLLCGRFCHGTWRKAYRNRVDRKRYYGNTTSSCSGYQSQPVMRHNQFMRNRLSYEHSVIHNVYTCLLKICHLGLPIAIFRETKQLFVWCRNSEPSCTWACSDK